MAKMRGIKPEFWTDEKIVSVSRDARLLFIGLWNHACDNGHVDDSAIQLKMRVFPADNIDVAPLVEELVGMGLLERGDGWLKAPKMSEHQKIDRRYLRFCTHCEHDGNTTFTEDDRIPKKSNDADIQQSPNGRTSGTRRALVDEGEGEGEGEKKVKHSLPSSWTPTKAHQERAKKTGINVDVEAEKFRNHAHANGRKQVNWNSAFSNWLINAGQWQKPRQAPSLPPLTNARDLDD